MEMTALKIEAADLEHLTDEEIVSLAKDGDTVALEFLIGKYKNFVFISFNLLFLPQPLL